MGLESPQPHIDRVAARVSRGSHPIPEETIRRRYELRQLLKALRTSGRPSGSFRRRSEASDVLPKVWTAFRKLGTPLRRLGGLPEVADGAPEG